ncbi:hypothetical protein GJ496_007141 [Pomphorhynchus laevis]|nr:hypothetical protein GJ496_007141 [Pomphorhynchus laevis]
MMSAISFFFVFQVICLMTARVYSIEKLGGLSDERTDNLVDIQNHIQSLKSDIEKHLSAKADNLEAISYKTQIVSGTNYFVKVKDKTTNDYHHLRIYKPLQHTGKPVELSNVVKSVSGNSPLSYF